MNINQFQNFIINLFSEKKLNLREEEYGITASGRDDIKRIGYSTNLTPEVIDEAVKNKIDLIITHHDAWDFVYGMKEFCVEKLEQNKIGHFYVHLPLDDADFGTSAALSEKLGLRIVEKTNNYDGYYCGRIGEFENPINLSTLVERIEYLLEEPVKSWKNNEKLIKRVGIVTGGGSMTNDVKVAVDQNCDVYITGEKVLYTIQYAKFAKINLIIGSHTFTEIFGVENLALKVKENFNEVEIIRLKEEHYE